MVQATLQQFMHTVKKKRLRAFSNHLFGTDGGQSLISLKAEYTKALKQTAKAEDFKEYAKSRIVALERELSETEKEFRNRKLLISRLQRNLKDTSLYIGGLESIKSEKNQELKKLKNEKSSALDRANQLEKTNASLGELLEKLETENSILKQNFGIYQKEHKQLRSLLKLRQNKISSLKEALEKRTIALIKTEKEKSRLIHRKNQEEWLKNQAQIKNRELEREKAMLEIAKEHNDAAIKVSAKSLNKERNQYKNHLKNLRKLLGNQELKQPFTKAHHYSIMLDD